MLEQRIRVTLWLTAIILMLFCIGRLGMLQPNPAVPDQRITALMDPMVKQVACV